MAPFHSQDPISSQSIPELVAILKLCSLGLWLFSGGKEV